MRGRFISSEYAQRGTRMISLTQPPRDWPLARGLSRLCLADSSMAKTASFVEGESGITRPNTDWTAFASDQ